MFLRMLHPLCHGVGNVTIETSIIFRWTTDISDLPMSGYRLIAGNTRKNFGCLVVKMSIKIMADHEMNSQPFKVVFFNLNTEIPSLGLKMKKGKTPINFKVGQIPQFTMYRVLKPCWRRGSKSLSFLSFPSTAGRGPQKQDDMALPVWFECRSRTS